MTEPILALIPSGYKNSKVYSILPNSGVGDFDFTRGSGATRVNKDGLIELMQTYGSQEIENSDFVTTDNWTINNTGTASTVIENGYVRFNTGGDYTEITQTGTSLVANELYRLDYEILENNNGNLGVVYYSNLTQLLPSTVGKHSVEFLANGTTFALKRYSGATDIKLSYAKVYKVQYNTPRLDWYNSNCPSLLLEPQRTNYATNNTSMDTYSTLGGSSPSPTLTADYTVAPDGTLTATRLQVSTTGTNYSLIEFPTTTLGNGNYTASVYVKSNTGSSQSIAFYGQSSSPNQRTATTEWTRIEFTGNRGTGLTKYVYLGTWNSNLGTDADLDISIWGAQIEVDSDYASSLIYTGASAVTRLKDEIFAEDSNLFDITEGTLFVDATPFKSGGGMEIQLSDGTANNRHTIQYQGTGTSVRALTVTGGTTVFSDYNPLTFEQKNKLAITFKKDEFKFYVNGSLVHTDTSGDVPTGLDKLTFSNPNLTGTFMEGKIHDIRVYDTVLTETEAIELTTL